MQPNVIGHASCANSICVDERVHRSQAKPGCPYPLDNRTLAEASSVSRSTIRLRRPSARPPLAAVDHRENPRFGNRSHFHAVWLRAEQRRYCWLMVVRLRLEGLFGTVYSNQVEFIGPIPKGSAAAVTSRKFPTVRGRKRNGIYLRLVLVCGVAC
jgi:hypothetical protein